MTYPISDIEGMSAFCASKLKAQGIRTTDALLEAARTVKGRKALAAKTAISEQQLLEWANVADYMRIPGMGKAKVCLMRAAGVTTVRAKHQGSEHQAQAGPHPAVGKIDRTHDRAGAQAGAQNQLLKISA
jgi:hypothetical protein